MKPAPTSVDDRSIEQRRADRRRFTFKTLYGTLFLRRRRTSRRDEDNINNYIDWYGPWPLVATLIIILLSCADAFLTLILLKKGAVELNLFMDWLITKDIRLFTATKMAMTGLSLIILVMHFNFRVYRFLPVRFVVYALVPLYALLVAHEINLLNQI